jgi:hypothetical protein
LLGELVSAVWSEMEREEGEMGANRMNRLVTPPPCLLRLGVNHRRWKNESGNTRIVCIRILFS